MLNLLFQGADPNVPATAGGRVRAARAQAGAAVNPVPAIVVPAAVVAQGQGRGQVMQQVSKFKHNMSITWLVFFVAP
jgi:hypothetical protein